VNGQDTTTQVHYGSRSPHLAGETLIDQFAGLRSVLEQAPVGLVVAEAPSGRIILFNAEATRILGHPLIPAEADADYTNYGAIHIDGSLYEPAEHPLARALVGEVLRDVTVRYRRGDAAVVRLSVSAAPIRGLSGEILGALTTFLDVTDRYLMEARVRARLERLVLERAVVADQSNQQLARLHAELQAISSGLEESVRQRTARLAYQAQHDHLTGLPNRALFEERLTHALLHAQRYDRQLAVIFLDLDGFKDVNDGYGHQAGDRLLQQVAHRLRAGLRRTDTIARFGGDEFVVLLPEIQEADDACEVAAALLSTMVEPFVVRGTPRLLTASAGVSIYPRDARDAADLQRHADAAMYRAKDEGGNGFAVYGDDQRHRLPADDPYVA
jgi:diguanylate cyclase (GGDEF)-like protein/PAS domain S-box-containing protein